MAASGDDIRNTGKENNRGDSPSPISLPYRAPTGPIPERTWHMYLRYGLGFLEHKNLLEQRNQCIRSRLAHLSHRNRFGLQLGSRRGQFGGGVGISYEATNETTSFPYPPAFQQMLRAQSRVPLQTQAHDEENQGGDLGDSGDNAVPGQNNLVQDDVRPQVIPDVGRLGGNVQAEQVERRWGLTNPWFGITRTTVIQSETFVQPVYVVLGIFPRGYSNPRERVVFIHKPEHLFWGLFWAAFRLRGLRSIVFSLRHVKAFRLYKCDAEMGTHERIELDTDGLGDLQLLLDTYKNWHVPHHITQAWANWIHQTLNNGSHDVLNGMYALELVLDWSMTRISIVVLLPVLLSLAIGLWLNASNWADLATIQTAWGTASYVVTAGGLLAALLGILSSIADK
ncbi:hypothetical protein N431DRAFT_483649 [Stipitochalara longipes BDJ]|nr:hypothetical protein N431DRAFT_483649 [Stipitochalara longipes BDJ]